MLLIIMAALHFMMHVIGGQLEVVNNRYYFDKCEFEWKELIFWKVGLMLPDSQFGRTFNYLSLHGRTIDC